MTVVVDEAVIRRIVAEEVQRAVQVALDARAHDGGTRGDVGDDGLMTAEQVAALLQVDRRTLRRMVLLGEVPAPITIGARTIRWRRRTLERWLVGIEKKGAIDASRAGWLHVRTPMTADPGAAG